jgi:hypothetical protein
MYYLPNRAYYPPISDIDSSQLLRMVSNVLIYAGLELLSFLAIGLLLQRSVGVSALIQLGFVLQTQWEMVQSKLLLWVFYSVQNTIAHMGKVLTRWRLDYRGANCESCVLCPPFWEKGADFSFEFKWMKPAPT